MPGQNRKLTPEPFENPDWRARAISQWREAVRDGQPPLSLKDLARWFDQMHRNRRSCGLDRCRYCGNEAVTIGFIGTFTGGRLARYLESNEDKTQGFYAMCRRCAWIEANVEELPEPATA